ncbi:MAG: hypothetical protein MJ093_05845 [Saccharofermentans sp.]|nr:hypothetical protein [Saccharofermentans sp.]
MIILMAMVLIPAIIWIVSILKHVKLPAFKKKVKVVPPKPVVIDKEKLRKHCLVQISTIERKHSEGKISSRSAFIMVSAAVREFISAVSSNNVSALTLKEITDLNMPALSDLIEQFYHPEFAFDDATEDEMAKAFVDARKVVTEWN